MVYGGGLENRFRLLANVGSNPTPSASGKKRGLAGESADFGHKIESCVCERLGEGIGS